MFSIRFGPVDARQLFRNSSSCQIVQWDVLVSDLQSSPFLKAKLRAFRNLVSFVYDLSISPSVPSADSMLSSTVNISTHTSIHLTFCVWLDLQTPASAHICLYLLHNHFHCEIHTTQITLTLDVCPWVWVTNNDCCEEQYLWVSCLTLLSFPDLLLLMLEIKLYSILAQIKLHANLVIINLCLFTWNICVIYTVYKTKI